MSSESNTETLVSNRSTFWITHATLEKRLSFLLPGYRADQVSIVTSDLASNASFVNYVRHHRLTDLVTGATVDVIEKSIRKILFISSLESRFYRERNVLAGSVHFKHPSCLGVIETPWESLIFTSYVKGRPPRLSAIAKTMAQGIAEIETLSGRHLGLAAWWQAPKFWTMDFFGLGTCCDRASISSAMCTHLKNWPETMTGLPTCPADFEHCGRCCAARLMGQ